MMRWDSPLLFKICNINIHWLLANSEHLHTLKICIIELLFDNLQWNEMWVTAKMMHGTDGFMILIGIGSEDQVTICKDKIKFNQVTAKRIYNGF